MINEKKMGKEGARALQKAISDANDGIVRSIEKRKKAEKKPTAKKGGKK